MSSIKAEEKPIQKIFCNDFSFRIPAYQRPYAWEVDQAGQLFDDLSTFMDEEGGDDTPYFLGSIVLIKQTNDAVADVVDGQQRLTTLTILFAAIRDRLPEPKKRAALEEFLREKGNEFLKTPDRFRFTPRDRDQDFFHNKVIGEDGLDTALDPAQLTDSQRNMWANAMHYRERLAKMSDDAVANFTGFVLQSCYLVVVTTTDFGAAYRIFSVLNDRGLDLQTTDILKAELIGDISEQARARYTERWEDIEQELGRDGFLELFAHIRTIHRKVKSKKNLLDEYKEHVLPKFPRPEAFVEEQMVPYANALQVLRDASYVASVGADRVNGMLRALHLISNVDWLPTAMRLFELHKNDAEELRCWLTSLERLAASMMIRRVYTTARLDRYARVLEWLEGGGAWDAEGSPFILDTQERADTRAVLAGPIYDLSKVRRPVLLRLDQLLADEGSRYDHKIISIEHVLPQIPKTNSKWLEWFPDEGERVAWTHRLGNLVLLSRRKNSKASNYDFKEKKDTYFKRGGVSSFALTTDVLNEDTWTPAVVEQRQARLLGVLEEAWKLA